MKEDRNCCNCIKGIAISINSDIFCKVNGAVSPDYVCSKHRFAPVPKTYKELDYKCIYCENFIHKLGSAKENNTIGLCQLFSVRYFDGTQKKACSKFIKRKEKVVC